MNSDQAPPCHPDWYVPGMAFDQPHHAFALRVGRQAGGVSGNEWPRVEAALHAVWVVLDQGQTWEQARPAVYHCCLQAKREG